MKKKQEKKNKIVVREAIINVISSFNNTIITAADTSGNTIAWSSAGLAGFKGSKKATPFAAQSATEDLVKKLRAFGVTTVSICMKGLGNGRESVLKGMHEFNVTQLQEKTPIPHNGTRLPKRRKP